MFFNPRPVHSICAMSFFYQDHPLNFIFCAIHKNMFYIFGYLPLMTKSYKAYNLTYCVLFLIKFKIVSSLLFFPLLSTVPMYTQTSKVCVEITGRGRACPVCSIIFQ